MKTLELITHNPDEQIEEIELTRVPEVLKEICLIPMNTTVATVPIIPHYK